MISFFKELKFYLSLFAAWLLVGIVIIAATDKLELHIWFNGFHETWANHVFKNATHLAEGLFIAFTIVLIAVRKIRYGVIAGLSFALAGLSAQLLKRQVFSDFKRPSKVFENIAELQFVPGVDLHANFSFPSGHSTMAFAIFLSYAFVFRKHPTGQIIAFCFAMLTAFSRVYLSQHFFEDIYAGSVLGTSSVLLMLYAFRHQTWGEEGLFDKITHNRK